MTTAVIGTGFVGGTLGRAFARAGIPTVFGSRHPHEDAADGSGARTTSIAEAVEAAQTVVLALPGGAVEDFLREHGGTLAGRLVVDAANNVGGAVTHHAGLVAAHAPKARYARAFNSLGGEVFADPEFDGVRADLFFSCGEADRPAVEELISAVGLRPMYLGEDQQDLLDGLLRLWFTLAIGRGHGRHLAFRTLTRPGH